MTDEEGMPNDEAMDQVQGGGEGAVPPGEDMGPSPNDQGENPAAIVEAVQEGGGLPEDLPPALKQEIVEGSQLLFYTAVELAMNPLAKKRMDPLLKQGKLFDASRYLIDQTVKNNKGQKMSGPMLIVSIYYITEFVASLGRSRGYKITEDDVKESTMLNIDHFTGQMLQGKAAKKMDEEATARQKMREAQALDRQQPTSAPRGGRQQPIPVPQGGMM